MCRLQRRRVSNIQRNSRYAHFRAIVKTKSSNLPNRPASMPIERRKCVRVQFPALQNRSMSGGLSHQEMFPPRLSPLAWLRHIQGAFVLCRYMVLAQPRRSSQTPSDSGPIPLGSEPACSLKTVPGKRHVNWPPSSQQVRLLLFLLIFFSGGRDTEGGTVPKKDKPMSPEQKATAQGILNDMKRKIKRIKLCLKIRGRK